jgi:hypothetical protein
MAAEYVIGVTHEARAVLQVIRRHNDDLVLAGIHPKYNTRNAKGIAETALCYFASSWAHELHYLGQPALGIELYRKLLHLRPIFHACGVALDEPGKVSVIVAEGE